MEKQYVLGADFGSDSVRTVILDAQNGEMAGEASAVYPRWSAGMYQHPERNIFRQHPLDYVEAFETAVKKALSEAGAVARKGLYGIGIDTTGSTPCPVDKEGVPLALLEPFSGNEGAMFHLWKDHCAAQEAEEIQTVFSNWKGLDYTKYQGNYSSEWYWAKILHTVRRQQEIRENAYSWVEHCDWMPSLLCQNTKPDTMYRSACGAGHKALYHSEWQGLPAASCLENLDSYLKKVRDTYGRPLPADRAVGRISEKWADRLGISGDVMVGGSSFDAHAGAVGAGIHRGVMVSNIGTSAVDLLVEPAETLKGKGLRHVCGMAEDSVIPGLMGIETGQAAFGDVYAWLKRLMLWPLHDFLKRKQGEEKKTILALYRDMEGILLEHLAEGARGMEPASSAVMPISLDWYNGRRYPDTDDRQRAAIAGLGLESDGPSLYRSLVLGTVCGLKKIIDEIEEEGIPIKEIIAAGGIAEKSDYVMQIMADMLERTIKIAGSSQTCAVGAAIYGAVGSGIYKSIPEAQEHICSEHTKIFLPNECGISICREYYGNYNKLADFIRQFP